MSGPATTPATFTMSVTETLAFPIDMSAYLSSGQSVASPTATLVRLDTNVAVTLSDNPSTSGNVVTQIIRGSELVANERFRLTVNFTASPSSNIWAAELIIVAVP